MTHDIIIPTVGESITSGVLTVWHKKNGDVVSAGDLLLTLETDKVSTEIVAEESGVLETLAAEESEVQVGEVVGRIAVGAGAASPTPSPVVASDPPTAAQPTSVAADLPPSVASHSQEHSPAVRRIVAEESVVTREVKSSGKGGRITKADVLGYLQQRGAEASAEASGAATAPEAVVSEAALVPPSQSASHTLATSQREVASAVPMTTRRRMSPLRKKIAAQLVSVQREAAILTTFNECDMSAVKAVRARMKDSFAQRHGVKLGFMSFFVKAVVNALIEVPSINARIDGDDIIENHFYDIGVAVGTERGLVVPVVREAERKSFAEIERDLAAYAEKARAGQIKLDDMRGGGFTITNGGVYGSLMSTPILNPPQSGILGMHTIKERPVVVEGEIVARPMMYLALSYDHRIVDGKDAVTFLIKVKEAIEDPMQLLL